MPNPICSINHLLTELWPALWWPVALVLIFWCFPTGLVGWWLKSVPMRESELKHRLSALILQAGFHHISLNVWPATRRKRANAMVSGFFAFRIDIADYFIRQLRVEELEFILAHELGHVKRRHIWIRRIVAFLGVPPWVGLNIVLERAGVLPGAVVIVVYLVLYYGLFHQYIARQQELEADEYALELGLSPQVVVAALSRLGRNQRRKWYVLDERFLSHPPIKVRISNILRIANLPDAFNPADG